MAQLYTRLIDDNGKKYSLISFCLIQQSLCLICFFTILAPIISSLGIYCRHSAESLVLPSLLLQGRLGQVCVVGDVLQPNQVKSLFSFSSPSSEIFNVFDTQPDLDPVKDRRLFHFHPKCAQENVCYDLSDGDLVGRLTGIVRFLCTV